MGGYYGTPTRMNGLNPGQHRDTQRSRLYKADDVLDGMRVSAAAKRHLTDSIRHAHLDVIVKDDEGKGTTLPLYYPSVESTQDYVDAVTAAAWFRRRWGFRRIPVQHSHGGSSGAWADGSISVSVQHRRSEAVILHEIAHVLTPHPYAHHGPEFAGILLTLVKHVMGPEAAALLRESFRTNRVRYSMKAVPTGSDARRRTADATAKRRGITVRRTTRTPAATTRTPRATSALTPVTYEDAYKAGYRWPDDWDIAKNRWLDRNDRRIRVAREQAREAGTPLPFDYFGSAYDDGYLDAAAGREKFHLRDCKAHHNNEGGCGVA